MIVVDCSSFPNYNQISMANFKKMTDRRTDVKKENTINVSPSTCMHACQLHIYSKD